MNKKFVYVVLAYVVTSMICGMLWHFVFFDKTYHSLGIYNRIDPIIPLGLLSMTIQGIIIAYLFPFYYKDGNSIAHGIKFSLIIGLFLFSVSALANAAKIEVASMSTWIILQASFHFVQFIIVGILIGFVYSKR